MQRTNLSSSSKWSPIDVLPRLLDAAHRTTGCLTFATTAAALHLILLVVYYPQTDAILAHIIGPDEHQYQTARSVLHWYAVLASSLLPLLWTVGFVGLSLAIHRTRIRIPGQWLIGFRKFSSSDKINDSNTLIGDSKSSSNSSNSCAIPLTSITLSTTSTFNPTINNSTTTSSTSPLLSSLTTNSSNSSSNATSSNSSTSLSTSSSSFRLRFITPLRLAQILAPFVILEIVAVIVELMLYRDMEVHMLDFDIAAILFTGHRRREIGIKRHHLVYAALAFVIGATIAVFLVRIVHRGVLQFPIGARRLVITLIVLSVVAFTMVHWHEHNVGPHWSEIHNSLPLRGLLLLDWSDIEHIPITYKLGPMGKGYPFREHRHSSGPPEFEPLDLPEIPAKKNLLLVLSESTNAMYFSNDTAPHMHRFFAERNCIRSRTHVANAHVTESALFSFLYGLHITLYNEYMLNHIPSYLLKTLEHNGYEVRGLISSVPWSFPNRWTIDQLPHAENLYDDDKANKRLHHFIDQRRQWQRDGDSRGDRPWAIILFYWSVHYPYASDPKFWRYEPHLHNVPPRQAPYGYEERAVRTRNSYRNRMLEFDAEFGKILDYLRPELDAGQTVLTFMGDHGQEAWEHGGMGHSHRKFWAEKIEVPFAMCFPDDGGAEKKGNGASISSRDVHRHPTLTSHIDVIPTLLHAMGVNESLLAQVSHGRSFWRADDWSANRTDLFITGRHFPAQDKQSCWQTPAGRRWFSIHGHRGRRLAPWHVSRRTTLLDEDLCADPATQAQTKLMDERTEMVGENGGENGGGGDGSVNEDGTTLDPPEEQTGLRRRARALLKMGKDRHHGGHHSDHKGGPFDRPEHSSRAMDREGNEGPVVVGDKIIDSKFRAEDAVFVEGENNDVDDKIGEDDDDDDDNTEDEIMEQVQTVDLEKHECLHRGIEEAQKTYEKMFWRFAKLKHSDGDDEDSR